MSPRKQWTVWCALCISRQGKVGFFRSTTLVCSLLCIPLTVTGGFSRLLCFSTHRQHKDVALVNMANILHRAHFSADAAILAHAALDLTSDLFTSHYTLGNIYAVGHTALQIRFVSLDHKNNRMLTLVRFIIIIFKNKLDSLFLLN